MTEVVTAQQPATAVLNTAIVEVPTERVAVASYPSVVGSVEPSRVPVETTGQPKRRNPISRWFHNFKKAWKDLLYLTIEMFAAWPTGAFIYFIGFIVVSALWIIAAFVDNWSAGGLLIGFISLPIAAFIISWLVRAARGYVGMYRGIDRGIFKADIQTPPPFDNPRYFRKSVYDRLTDRESTTWREPFRGFWRSFVSRISDVTAWRSLLYMFVNVLLAVVGWVVSMFWLFASLALITYPLWWRFSGDTFPDHWQDGTEIWVRRPGVFSLGCYNLYEYGSGDEVTGTWTQCRYLPADNWWRIALVALTGLLLLAFWPFIVRMFTRAIRKLGDSLLGPTKGSLEVAALRSQRAATVADSDDRLRQIERDLHDGTQAQLTTIAMQIGEARELLKAASAPAEVEIIGGQRVRTIPSSSLAAQAEAAAILETAHQSTKDAMANLREIASGVRPASLDAGLVVALQTLCARSPIPVEFERWGDIDEVDPRVTNWVPVDPAIRSIAYYTVNELLANAAKHSHATKIWVRVSRPQTMTVSDELIIQYMDNGWGGARIIPEDEREERGDGHGTGLAGLQERLATVDGTISISSPLGAGGRFGQTIILVTLPATLSVKWNNEANAYI